MTDRENQERESVKEMTYKLLGVISEHLETMDCDGLRELAFDCMGRKGRNEWSLWIQLKEPDGERATVRMEVEAKI